MKIHSVNILLDQDSWSRRIHSSWSYVFKRSSKRFQDVLFKTSSRCLAETSSRHLQDVLPRRLQDIFKTSRKNIFKTFSRRIIKLNCSCYHSFKTSSRRNQRFFETYCEDDHLQKDLLRSHFWEIYGHGTAKFPRVNSLSITKLLKQFLLNHFEKWLLLKTKILLFTVSVIRNQ